MSDKVHVTPYCRRRIALFAHWDPDCIIDPYVVSYLGELGKIADIAFYSDCDLPQAETSKIESICVALGAGRHEAYDFGSYRKAYEMIADRLNEYDELILANDSCYGPFIPLEKVFEKMESNEIDYWGLTEHASAAFGGAKHLQSYFVVMKRKVFLSDCFQSFIMCVRPESDKRDVIRKYEVGLSLMLEKQGFKRGSLIDFTERNVSYNGDAVRLVAAASFPFIKREMLALNPCFCPMLLKSIKSISKSSHPETVKMMLIHLNRFSRGGYASSWGLIMAPNFNVIHRKFIRLKPVLRNGKYQVKLIFLGISILRLPLPVTQLNHEEIIRNLLLDESACERSYLENDLK